LVRAGRDTRASRRWSGRGGAQHRGSLPIHFRGVMTGRVWMAAVRDLSSTVGLLVALAGAPALAQEREPAAPLPLNELRTFTEVLERIRTSYVEEVDDATLLENAIR